MFWFIFIFALLAYGLCHVANVYRIKSHENGESKIGLFQPSICPFCRNCKKIIFITFIITVFNTFMILYSQDKASDWSFLGLNHASWEAIHILIAVAFVIALIMYFYIHSEALAAEFKKILK